MFRAMYMYCLSVGKTCSTAERLRPRCQPADTDRLKPPTYVDILPAVASDGDVRYIYCREEVNTPPAAFVALSVQVPLGLGKNCGTPIKVLYERDTGRAISSWYMRERTCAACSGSKVAEDKTQTGVRGVAISGKLYEQQRRAHRDLLALLLFPYQPQRGPLHSCASCLVSCARPSTGTPPLIVHAP